MAELELFETKREVFSGVVCLWHEGYGQLVTESKNLGLERQPGSEEATDRGQHSLEYRSHGLSSSWK